MTEADTKLMRLFSKFRRAWAAFGDEADDDDAQEAKATARHGEYRDVVTAMQEIPSSSLTGLCVKAQVYAIATAPGGGEAYEDLAQNLVADCLRLGRIQCPAAVREMEGVRA